MKPRYFALPLLVLPLALAACGGTQPGGNGASTAATLANPAIASTLQTMARRVRAAPSASTAAALSTRMIHVNRERQIQIYIHVKQLEPTVKQAIENVGAAHVMASKPLGLYQAWATPDTLARIAALAGVTKITPPVYGFPRTGNNP
jgi:hypothetical protein